MKKSLDNSQTTYEYAMEIEKAGKRAASLTRQLLAFSRQQVLTPSVLSLNSLVSDMEKMLPRLLGEDIEVSLSLEPELGNVKADQSQIEQVIMNLAVNARDAMPSGGKLQIQTANLELDHAYTRDHPGSKAGSYVMLAIADTGTGMNPETIAHIFEPFFTTKGVGEGTGLGLATVYGVVETKQRIYLGGQYTRQRIDFSDLPSKAFGHGVGFRCQARSPIQGEAARIRNDSSRGRCGTAAETGAGFPGIKRLSRFVGAEWRSRSRDRGALFRAFRPAAHGRSDARHERPRFGRAIVDAAARAEGPLHVRVHGQLYRWARSSPEGNQPSAQAVHRGNFHKQGPGSSGRRQRRAACVET